MGTMEIILLAVELAEKYLPAAIKAGTNLMPFAEDLYRQIEGKELTDDERMLLRARVDAVYARAMVPLPEAQPGDPDFLKNAP